MGDGKDETWKYLTGEETSVISPNLVPSKFSLVVMAQDGTELLRLSENEEGKLDAEYSDPERVTEAAENFVRGVREIWGLGVSGL